MQKKRALVTTALLTSAVGLWGCTASTGSLTSEVPPVYQQTLVTQANQQAVQSMTQLPPNTQFAVLQTGTRTDVPSGILQPGSIILRRSTVVEKPMPAEELAATMRRIASEAASQQLQAEKPIILAAAEQKIDSKASEIKQYSSRSLQESEARLQAYSTQQSAEVADALKAYAEKNTAATADELRAYAQAIAEKTNQLQQDLTEAEKRQQNFVVNELAFREQSTEQKLANLKERQEILLATSKDYARAEALAAQLAAQSTTIQQAQEMARQAQISAQQAEVRAKEFAAEKMATGEQSTEQKLANLKERQEILLATSKDYARAEALAAQLAAQSTSIQQAQESTRLAQASAQQAEARAKEFAAEKLATLAAEGKLTAEQTRSQIAAAVAENKLSVAQTQGQIVAATAETKLAVKETQEQIAAAKAENKLAVEQTRNQIIAAAAENKLVAEQTKGQIAAAAAAAAAENKLMAQSTAQELKAIREAQAQQQALFQNTILQVSKELKSYGDNQLASLANETRTTISQTAAIAQQSTAELTQQTTSQLAKLRAEAANRTEQLATTLTNRFAENINALAEETEAKRLTPEQVSNAANSAAAEAVTSAAPQFRALALQTLADSQDYIRTVAQESLTDDADPAVQEALQKAAKNVITKDDQVVFAIREALTPKPASPKLPADEPRTMLGDGPRPDAITADVMLNAKALGVAALAGVSPAAGPDHLASLNPVGSRSLGTPRHRQDWIDLRKYRVVVHEDGATLEKLMARLMAEATPYTGPWQVKWKLKPENQDLAQEIFSLDAETTFEDFVTYLSQYVQNARGVKLSFNLFDAEHILIISD